MHATTVASLTHSDPAHVTAPLPPGLRRRNETTQRKIILSTKHYSNQRSARLHSIGVYSTTYRHDFMQSYCCVSLAYAVNMSDATGPAIDPETACLACGSQSRPESMVICDKCQQDFHLKCFGLPSIPGEDEWICHGCSE